VVDARDSGRLLLVDMDVLDLERRRSAAIVCWDGPSVYTKTKRWQPTSKCAPEIQKLHFNASDGCRNGCECRRSLSQRGDKAGRVIRCSRVLQSGAGAEVDQMEGNKRRMAIADIRRMILRSKIEGGRGVVARLVGVDVEMSVFVVVCFV